MSDIEIESVEERRAFDHLEAIKHLIEPKQNTYARPLTKRMTDTGEIDAFGIATAYELDAMRFAALKKILTPGSRNGGKSKAQDINEAIEALQRFKQEYCS